MEQYKLAGKVVIVTGGTGVLGYSFNQALAQQGAIVGILGRNTQKARERADEIVDRGGQAFPLIADVLNEDQLKMACAETLSLHGRVDGLVNAAGGNMPGRWYSRGMTYLILTSRQ